MEGHFAMNGNKLPPSSRCLEGSIINMPLQAVPESQRMTRWRCLHPAVKNSSVNRAAVACPVLTFLRVAASFSGSGAPAARQLEGQGGLSTAVVRRTASRQAGRPPRRQTGEALHL